MLPKNKNLKQYARELRNNMTDAERKLWSRIRRKQLKEAQFYRQRVIGNYIVDFYFHSAGLVIEVDGGQHFTQNGKETDLVRDSYLKGLGLKELRFSNSEVINKIDGVVEKIYSYL
jgi:very-short-patch-repair endonuclease